MTTATRLGGWITACAIAEAIGMTAAAAAARIADALPAGQAVAGFGLVVAGGLVEGTALGLLQARWLGRRFPMIQRAAWAIVTMLIAGLGWAGASLPSRFGDPGGEQPALGLILLRALALGAVMGAVLGVGLTLVLRGAVRHPWRWVAASTAAWAPTMVVIFAGATAPDPSWSPWPVVGLGLVTGALAGAVLGGVSGAFMDALDPA